MATSWLTQLDNCRSEKEVAAVARDYFAMWSPAEIGLLPSACRPPHIRDATDLEELNRRGVEAFRQSRATGEALALLQRFTGFVGNACVRVAQLGAAMQRENAAAGDASPVKQEGDRRR